jgi:hypothetical protein
MTLPETIMTIKMQCAYVADVSRTNDVLVLPGSLGLHLSASVWTVVVRGSLIKAQCECLSEVLRHLRTQFPDYEFWLLAGHDSVQPDTRITRYNGFWMSLQRRGIPLPKGLYLEEYTVRLESGFRAFGAVRFEPNQVEESYNVMRASQAAIIVAPESDARQSVAALIEKGWHLGGSKPPSEILSQTCGHSGFVVDFYGGFDDREVLVAVFGTPTKIRAIVEAQPGGV